MYRHLQCQIQSRTLRAPNCQVWREQQLEWRTGLLCFLSRCDQILMNPNVANMVRQCKVHRRLFITVITPTGFAGPPAHSCMRSRNSNLGSCKPVSLHVVCLRRQYTEQHANRQHRTAPGGQWSPPSHPRKPPGIQRIHNDNAPARRLGGKASDNCWFALCRSYLPVQRNARATLIQAPMQSGDAHRQLWVTGAIPPVQPARQAWCRLSAASQTNKQHGLSMVPAPLQVRVYVTFALTPTAVRAPPGAAY